MPAGLVLPGLDPGEAVRLSGGAVVGERRSGRIAPVRNGGNGLNQRRAELLAGSNRAGHPSRGADGTAGRLYENGELGRLAGRARVLDLNAVAETATPATRISDGRSRGGDGEPLVAAGTVAR